MDNQTIEENNTMQFRPKKIDSSYIHDYTMVECNSYYFSTSTIKTFNSKIKRVLLVDTNEDRKNSKSNLFSVYGYIPYTAQGIITVLLEEVEHFFDHTKEYKIIVLHNNKMLFNRDQDNFTDYQQARIELDRLEIELKLSIDCLKDFN